MKDIFIKLLMVVVVFALAAIFLTIPVYFLWNWVMPEIFGLKAITLGQAFGLSLLSKCLFSGNSSSSKKND